MNSCWRFAPEFRISAQAPCEALFAFSVKLALGGLSTSNPTNRRKPRRNFDDIPMTPCGCVPLGTKKVETQMNADKKG